MTYRKNTTRRDVQQEIGSQNIRHNAGLWNTAVREAKAFLEHWPEED